MNTNRTNPNRVTSDIVNEILRKGRIVEAEEEEKDTEEQNSEEKEPKAKGEPNLYKLSDKVVGLLTDRIKDEYYAHYLYRTAANWCQDMNYKKAAAFFEEDANKELEHAQTIQKYLADFNIVIKMPQSETGFEFENLMDIIYQAYDFELGLMKSYNKDSQDVFQEDLTTFDFLQQFREIQRESVVEFNDFINGANLVDKTDKFQILYFEQTYF
jgi:ferritin